MPLGLGLQSAVMYPTGKLFHGSSTIFVLLPFLIYVVTSSLLLVVEGSQTSPSPSQSKEAQTIIGRFLRNEGGATWLSKLVKANSAPLTTQDLMSAILRTTRKGGRVWKAAKILSEGLKLRALNGTSSDVVMGQNENWKDLIANIEMEDDIICLYRKNSNETTKKADDWKEFLRTVSPGYTVHLAIDTGYKYVICLKKIDVPETTTESTRRILMTAETTSPLSMEQEKNTTIPPEELKKEPKKGSTDLASGKSDESCENCNTGDIRDDGTDIDDEYIDDNYDDDSLGNDNKWYKNNRRMQDNLSVKSNDIMNSGSELHRPIGDGGYSSRTLEWPRLSASLPWIYERFVPPIAQNPECNRPIIFVVPNVNVMSAYQPQLPMGIPFNQNFMPKLPRMPQNSMPFSKMPGAPYNYFPLSKNSQNLMRVQNQGYHIVKDNTPAHKGIHRPITPQKTHFPNETSNKKIHSVRSFVNATPRRIQTTRNTLGSQIPDVKFRVRNDVQRRPNFLKNPTYLIPKSFPRRTESSVSKKQKNSSDQLTAVTRNVLLPKNSKQTNQMGYKFLSRMGQARNEYQIPQSIKSRVDSQLPSRVPIFRPSQVVQKPISQLFRPLIYDRSRLQQSPIVNEDLLARPPTPLIQNFNQIDPSSMRSVENRPQVPCTIVNPMTNYPVRNNFVQLMGPVTYPWNFNVPCPTTSNQFDDRCAVNHLNNPSVLRCNNPLNCPTVGYENNPFPCPTPCDRPIKLQIVINGKIQEPLSVAVLADSGQKLEIVGSGTAIQPYGSRSLTGRMTERNEFYDQDNIQPEISERMAEGEEKMEDSPSFRNTLVNSDYSEDEENSPKRNETERTSTKSEIENNEAIVDRLLDDTIGMTSSLEANGTVTTTTNSTIIVV